MQYEQENGSIENASICNKLNFGFHCNTYATGMEMNINANSVKNSHKFGIKYNSISIISIIPSSYL